MIQLLLFQIRVEKRRSIPFKKGEGIVFLYGLKTLNLQRLRNIDQRLRHVINFIHGGVDLLG